MRTLFLIPVFLLASSFAVNDWGTDFEKARQEARSEHKLILLSFSGSDWCVPCISMHKEIFENPAFQSFAGTKLVLVNADFPRLKKHQLSKELQQQNDRLAGVYNPSGIFPLTLLINGEGKVLHSWEGKPSGSAEKFVEQLKVFTDAGN